MFLEHVNVFGTREHPFLPKEVFSMRILFNPFAPSAPFSNPVKTSEYLTVFWCFQRVEKGCIGNKWVDLT